MKRLDIRTFFSSSTKNISTNIETEPSETTEPIENPENNDGNNSLCLNKSKNENSNPVIDLGSLDHDIQNEILNIVSNSTIKVITNEIRKCGKYSLMCDEARSFKEEQLSLCVRYCNGFEICERFIKFIDCSQSRDAESLKNIIINELKQLEIADIPIVAQTYDGASVMSGAVGGLQTKIREKYPTAVYFHCAAHKLALVVTDTCKNIRSSVTFFNLLESL
ncbi:hypothetical protein ACI65C_009965 [Semiaphis heraclei]